MTGGEEEDDRGRREGGERWVRKERGRDGEGCQGDKKQERVIGESERTGNRRE